MGGSFARGTYAIGDCMQCGFQYPLHDLRVDGRYPAKKMLVCEACWDPWDPQEHPWPPIDDPIALKQPAPEVGYTVIFRDIIEGGSASTASYWSVYAGGAASTTAAEYEFNAIEGGASA